VYTIFLAFFVLDRKANDKFYPPTKEFLSLLCSLWLLWKLLNILSSFIFNYMAWHFFLCMQIAFLFISIIIVVALNNIYLRSVHTTPGKWWWESDKKDVWMTGWWYKEQTTQVDEHYSCCSVIFYSWARSKCQKIEILEGGWERYGEKLLIRW
jgi:hypothetical protein